MPLERDYPDKKIAVAIQGKYSEIEVETMGDGAKAVLGAVDHLIHN